MKRSYLIITAIGIIVIIGVLIFVFVSRNQPSSTTPGTGTGTTGSLPGTGTQTIPGNSGGVATGTGGPVQSFSPGTAARFGIISDEPVVDYFVDAQNNVTVVEPDGKIATIQSGQPSFLSSNQIAGLLTASFSHDGSRILVNFGDPKNPQSSVFTIATKAWTPLPTGIIAPVWSPNDNRIAYLQTVSGNTETLFTLDTSKAGNRPISLSALQMEDLSIAWPNKAEIVIQDKTSAYAAGSAWTFNLTTNALSQALSSIYGLQSLWSNTTSSAAVFFGNSTVGAYGGALSLWVPSASTTQTMSVLTLPSKCAFNYQPAVPGTGTSTSTATSTGNSAPSAPTSSSYLALYCGIPQTKTALADATLPDDYLQMAVFTDDAFYRINTDTGAIDPIFTPPAILDASNLRVINKILFFVNRYDQKLYAISLSGV